MKFGVLFLELGVRYFDEFGCGEIVLGVVTVDNGLEPGFNDLFEM